MSIVDTQTSRQNYLGKRRRQTTINNVGAIATSTTCSQQHSSDQQKVQETSFEAIKTPEKKEQTVDSEEKQRVINKLRPNVGGQISLRDFCVGKDGQKVQTIQKVKKHHRSLWKDEDLQPKDLEGEDIFHIIMPWVAEKAEEEKKAGILPQASGENTVVAKSKTQSDQKDTKACSRVKTVQQTLSFSKKAPTPTPASIVEPNLKSPRKAPTDTKASKGKTFDREIEILKMSHIQRVDQCELFDFEFDDIHFDGSPKKDKVSVRDAEGILINPRWAQYDYVVDRHGVGEMKARPGTGLTLEEFKQLEISKEVMQDGILFIWVEKEIISEIIDIFEALSFNYIENLCHVMIDREYEESTRAVKNTDATPLIARQEYTYLNKSHRTLLMMRRQPTQKEQIENPTQPLELRHQRTGDVVFDWTDPQNRFKTPEYYTYKLIETLLPKAMAKECKEFDKAPKQVGLDMFERARKFKLIELFAQNDEPRRGWLKVYSEAHNSNRVSQQLL